MSEPRTQEPIEVAILDDYQNIALQMADWSAVEKAGARIQVFRDHLKDEAAVADRLASFTVICAMRERTPFGRTLFEKLPNLKLLISTGSRNAAIDLGAARDHGVTVCSTGYVNHGAAELTWALILAIGKGIYKECDSLRHGGWQVGVGFDLKGKTLGILGLGTLGSSVARYAEAFSMQRIAWSPNLTTDKAQAAGATLVTKERLFAESDIVTIHMVLSDRSRGIVGASDLARMQASAYLVNTSRGPLIDEKALIHALKENKIAGAALDVFDDEPLPSSHPFRTLPNALCTPHIGYGTEETYRIFFRDTVENIVAWMHGKPIRVMH